MVIDSFKVTIFFTSKGPWTHNNPTTKQKGDGATLSMRKDISVTHF